jgi:hypothetical protein
LGVGENSPLFISIKQKINTMKVTFNFKKSTCRLNWIKILKVVFGFNLKEAKAIVDSGSYVHIVDNLNNPIDMQQYFIDLLIRIDSACISTLDADQRKVELRDVISLSIFDKEENMPSNTPVLQEINVQDLDTVKIGSVYILTQERYEKLLKAEQTWLMIKAALCNE